ncbi:MAG: tetratricopeptide repeat protein, partial [Deltaproteobacteria bacterium]
ILDKAEPKVNILDKDYKPIGSFGKSGSDKGKFSEPSSIAADDAGHIFVSDTGNHRIQVFDNEGKYLFDFGGKGSTDGKMYSPGGLAYKTGKVWVADTGNNRIQIFSQDGIFLNKIGKKGSYPGELNQPMDVAVGSSGDVYVADYGNNWVQVFSPEGKALRLIGKEGSGKGEFLGPRSIVVDDDDRLFVLESEKGGFFGGGNNRVQAFNRKGEFLFRIASYGKGQGEISAAESISYANREDVNLFISDSGNNRLYVLAMKDAPSAPNDVRIESNEEGGRLSWKRAQESFVKGCRIYASRDPLSGYRLIEEVEGQDTSFDFRHKADNPDYFFGVAAVAKGGLEGPIATLPDLFKMGYDRYLAKNYNESAGKLAELLKQEPSHGKAQYYMGLSYLAIGGSEAIDKAKDIFSRLLYISEFEEAGRLNLGRIALMQGKFGAAEAELSKVLKMNPGNKEVYFLIGKTYFESGFYQKSLENLLKAAELDPGNSKIFEILGLVYHKSKAFEKAVSSFEKGLSIEPDNPVFHKELGETYLAVRELKKAREEFRAFLEKVPADTEVRLLLAETAIELKEGQEAYDHANILLAKNKNNPSARLIKGKALLLLEKKEDALLEFKYVIELDPKNEDGRFMLAFVYRELGLNKEATESLQRLIDTNKNHEAGHILMAEILSVRGNRDGAISGYRTVQRINPKNPATYLPLGKLLAENKDYEGARKELEKAVKYEIRNTEAYLFLGSVLKTLGRSGEAINAYQAASELNKENFLPHQELGKIYMDNSILDKAIGEFKTALTLAPQNNADIYGLLGHALLKRLRFDEAIDAFAMAAKIDPQETSKNELNEAYEAKKKFLEVKQNVPLIEIRDAAIQKVFASLYKYYNDHPIGEIKISNNSDDRFSSVKVSLKVMKYMDFPADKEVKDVKPRAIETVPLNALFNNRILEIVEDTPAQAEVEVSYYRDGKEEKNKLTIPFTIYNRNSITWDNPAMTGAFVTPKDEPVKEFARGLLQQYPETPAFFNKQMATAMLVFDALGAYGAVYSPDSNNPYEKVSLGGAIDSLQYPRETLKLKTGDCDDLSTLLAALLENLGMETALIGTPGHLHMMFKLDTDPKKADTISLNPEQYVIFDNQVWIPVEATLIGSSFNEAWYKGSELYYRWKKENKAEITKIHEAWGLYQPATLPPATWSPALPAKEKIDAIMSLEVNLQKTKRIAGIIKPLLAALEKKPKDTSTRMQLGLIYGENEFFAEAMKEFSEIISLEPENMDAYTNLGNIYLLAGKVDNALEAYKKAEGIAPKDSEIKANLAIVYYKKGMIKEAQRKFTEAVEINPGIRDERSFLNSVLSR